VDFAAGCGVTCGVIEKDDKDTAEGVVIALDGEDGLWSVDAEAKLLLCGEMLPDF
jgi:hypothetical protein